MTPPQAKQLAAAGGATGSPSSYTLLSSAGATIVIVKSGSAKSDANGKVAVTFAAAFPNGIIGFGHTVVSTSQGIVTTFQLAAPPTATGFSGYILQDNDDGQGDIGPASNITVFWTATGS